MYMRYTSFQDTKYIIKAVPGMEQLVELTLFIAGLKKQTGTNTGLSYATCTLSVYTFTFDAYIADLNL